VEIPAGEYLIGDDKPKHTYEGPRHGVRLRAFRIGRFPVTNAEWRWFMAAGGYDDPRWWTTDAAERWRRGEITKASRSAMWWRFRRMLQSTNYINERLAAGKISQRQAEDHWKALNTPDDQFQKVLDADGDLINYGAPRYWANPAFNNPLQPVVGICWYEARAYCAWLSHVTGHTWRLPTEAEWEAAARYGAAPDAVYPRPDGRPGPFDPSRYNTFETHIRAPTPVGIFPGGDTAIGLVDMAGNAYEWTSTKYDKTRFRYPYRDNDGREDPNDTDRQQVFDYTDRVLRGGSFYYTDDEARIAMRMRHHPGFHSRSTGFRLAREI
jgi:formylglycine-generating enzyme required for sulfatase activity